MRGEVFKVDLQHYEIVRLSRVLRFDLLCHFDLTCFEAAGQGQVIMLGFRELMDFQALKRW